MSSPSTSPYLLLPLPCLLLLLLLLLSSFPTPTYSRACQVRNAAHAPVNFYWMDVYNWGSYIPQTKVPLAHQSSQPLKTYETHRFFAAWAEEADEVPSWDPDSIPLEAQFVHRGFDQVITAYVNETTGQLYLDDWDIHEEEMGRLAKAVGGCEDSDEDMYAACIVAKGGAYLEKIEREEAHVHRHNQMMKDRMASAFCGGTGRFQTPPARSLEWEGRALDVLYESRNLTLFHLHAGFLTEDAVDALLLSAPENGTRHLEIAPSPKLAFDKSLVEAVEWAERFVAAQLQMEGGEEGEKQEEKVHLFRYNEKEFHAPPCDGRCDRLPLPVSEYAATLLMYPQNDLQQKETEMIAYKFTTPEGGEIGFTSQGDDAMLFLYKNAQLGYVPELLPHLIPCIGKAPEMFTASRWIRRRGGSGGSATGEATLTDEL